MTIQRGARQPGSSSDLAAMLFSLICLVHCLVLPIALAVLPAASHLLSWPEEVHVAAFALAAPISVVALVSGYRLHGRGLPASVAVVGIALLGLGAFAAEEILAEIGLSVCGSLLLLGGHYANLRRRRLRAGRAQPG